MSDAPNTPGAGGKRPPGTSPLGSGAPPGGLRPPTGSPLGYTGPTGPRPVPSVEPTPSFIPKLRPAPDPTELVPESEGWEDDTIATGPEPTAVTTPLPGPTAATPQPPRAAPPPGAIAGSRGSFAPRRGADPTPAPGEVRFVEPARPSPGRPVSLGSSSAPEGSISDVALQKILDDVRFAMRKEIPRLVDAELAPVLRAQQEILTKLDRLEAMIRLAQSSADEALQLANHAGVAAQAAATQMSVLPVVVQAAAPLAHAPVAHPHAPPPVAQHTSASVAAPALTLSSVAPAALQPHHADPLGSMAPVRPIAADVTAYSGGDIDIPNELTSGKGRGVKLMLLVAVLVLGAFAAMVISSNMH